MLFYTSIDYKCHIEDLLLFKFFPLCLSVFFSLITLSCLYLSFDFTILITVSCHSLFFLSLFCALRRVLSFKVTFKLWNICIAVNLYFIYKLFSMHCLPDNPQVIFFVCLLIAFKIMWDILSLCSDFIGISLMHRIHILINLIFSVNNLFSFIVIFTQKLRGVK